MGALLVVVGGFLLGGTVSLWRQAGQTPGDDARRVRQLHVAAVVLAVLAAGSLVAGLPQVM